MRPATKKGTDEFFGSAIPQKIRTGSSRFRGTRGYIAQLALQLASLRVQQQAALDAISYRRGLPPLAPSPI